MSEIERNLSSPINGDLIHKFIDNLEKRGLLSRNSDKDCTKLLSDFSKSYVSGKTKCDELITFNDINYLVRKCFESSGGYTKPVIAVEDSALGKTYPKSINDILKDGDLVKYDFMTRLKLAMSNIAGGGSCTSCFNICASGCDTSCKGKCSSKCMTSCKSGCVKSCEGRNDWFVCWGCGRACKGHCAKNSCSGNCISECTGSCIASCTLVAAISGSVKGSGQSNQEAKTKAESLLPEVPDGLTPKYTYEYNESYSDEQTIYECTINYEYE